MATERHIISMQGSITPTGGSESLGDVTLSIPFGARVGIVGPDPAIKSAMLRIIAGIEGELAGSLEHAPGVSIGLLSEETRLDDDKDVRGAILEGVAEIKALLQRFDIISREMASPLHIDEVQELAAEQTRLYKRIDTIRAWELDRRMIDASNALRCPSGRTAVSALSAGDRRRVALCRLILSSPDLLVLDDPTAHLDTDSIAWLDSFLADYPGTVVAATHDRMMLDGVAKRILDIADGAVVAFEGGYTAWSEDRLGKAIEPGSGESARRALARERQWFGADPAARQAARHLRTADYARQARRAFGPPAPERVCVPPGPPLDGPALVTEGLVKGRGEWLSIDTLTFQVPAGAIMGVVGPEDAGKSTLLRLLAGLEEPDAGSVRPNETGRLGFVGTEHDPSEWEQPVRDAIADGHDAVGWDGHSVPMRDYLSGFGFEGAIVETPVGRLSPGQRYRARLAKALRAGVNLLLLDEPDGDIDLDSRRLVEAVLDDFAGSVVMVSHDRWLLDRVATHILAFTGDSQLSLYEGSYQDYRLDRRRQQGAAADRPNRLRFKRAGD